MSVDTLEYRRTLTGWRWRLLAAGNRRKLANGGQGYSHLSEALVYGLRSCGAQLEANEIGDLARPHLERRRISTTEETSVLVERGNRMPRLRVVVRSARL